MASRPTWSARASAHVELIFVPLPPFIALTVASILQSRGSSRWLGIQLGLLVVAQYLISPEVLATVAILTVAAVACVAIRHPANVPEMIRTVPGRWVSLSSVVAVLLAYPVWMMLAGPQHFTGPALPTTNPLHNDLLSFLVPGPCRRSHWECGRSGPAWIVSGDIDGGWRLHRCPAPNPYRDSSPGSLVVAPARSWRWCFCSVPRSSRSDPTWPSTVISPTSHSLSCWWTTFRCSTTSAEPDLPRSGCLPRRGDRVGAGRHASGTRWPSAPLKGRGLRRGEAQSSPG